MVSSKTVSTGLTFPKKGDDDQAEFHTLANSNLIRCFLMAEWQPSQTFCVLSTEMFARGSPMVHTHGGRVFV
jgi:hypothetical protein